MSTFNIRALIFIPAMLMPYKITIAESVMMRMAVSGDICGSKMG